MSVLLHVAISISEPFKVMSLVAIGKLGVFGAFKVAEDALHRLPMNIARIFEEL